MNKEAQVNKLHGIAQFALFVTSYFPLFVLIIFRQVAQNINYLHWGGFALESLIAFFTKFGLSAFLILLITFGWIGYKYTFENLEEIAQNGSPVLVKDVKNKNSESIGYIATYIIPFLFQKFDSINELLSVVFLLFIIYRIYINSSLILVNPILSMWYAIYEIEYEENGIKRNGLIISKDKFLQEDEDVKLYELGSKLYFATNK